MKPGDAFELGYRTAASGFFFDGMEMIAALAPGAGGIDALRHAIALLFDARDRVNADMAHVAGMVAGAYGRPFEAPRDVDGYRLLLTDRVFDIVNRWSYIADIQQVNQLQAWFYAGFGLGRAETVTRGIALFERLRELTGVIPPLDQMPANLSRMAAEASKQMETAAAEDDLSALRPLFDDAAGRLRATALLLRRDPDDIGIDEARTDDLRAFVDLAHRVRLDFARPRSDA